MYDPIKARKVKKKIDKSVRVVAQTPRQKKRNRRKLRDAIHKMMMWYNSLAVQYLRHHPGARRIRIS